MSTSSLSSSDVLVAHLRLQADRLLAELAGQTRAYFAGHEAELVELVRAHMLTLLDARPAPARAQNLRSASMLLHKQGELVKTALRKALAEVLDEEVAQALPAVPGTELSKAQRINKLDGTSLSLIDMCEVERILLLDRVAQRFGARYEADVAELSLRLTALLGADATAASCNPFRPEVFVRAMLTGWEQAGLDDSATEDVMLSLAPEHFVDLAPLYRVLNATLEHAGVMAHREHRIKRPQGWTEHSAIGRAEVSPNPALQADVSPPAPDPPHPLRAEPTLPRGMDSRPVIAQGPSDLGPVRAFLQRIGVSARRVLPEAFPASAPSAPAAQDELPTLAPALTPTLPPADPEFMGYLGGLQSGGHLAGVGTQAQQTLAEHNVLRQMREHEQVRRAPELDRGTVDALAEVFDFVFADQTIPLQMKFVIGRLQIPVLKAAMIDRDFFLSAEHPARRLVDTLAHASIAWAPEKGETDPLYVRIENTVKRVLNEFEDDLALFSELLLEFTEFLFETEQQARVQLEPVAQQELVGESREQALAHADEVVHARIKEVLPPLRLVPFLIPFLTQQWREVMARAWAHVPQDPAPWDDAVAVMDQLIWSTHPKTSAVERRELVAVLPALVRKLNAGLDAIEWTGEARANFTRRLIATHTLAIRVSHAPEPDTAAAVAEERAGATAMQELEQRRVGQLAGELDEYDAMARTFKRGLWFDFALDRSTRHRCLLSWVSPMRTRLLFTNRDGFDAFVRSEREVAALLRYGRLTVIDQEPIVARAIDRIMKEPDSGKDASAVLHTL